MEIKKGITLRLPKGDIDIHDVSNGIVYYQTWPNGTEKQGMYANLFRMPINDFSEKTEGAEIIQHGQ
jgi:hypothetical protein